MATECSSGCSLFYHWVMFESSIHNDLGDFYHENPIGSRVIATPIALIMGMAKVILFPVICAIGIIAMPIIAMVKVYQGKPEWEARLSAWCFCVLGLASFATFICVSTFHIPLNASIGLLIVFFSISISIHGYELFKEPQPLL